MPIVFKSKQSPNVVMLDSVARTMIRLMGHSGAIPGSLGVDDVANALDRLRRQVDGATTPAEPAGGDDERGEPRVSLAHRALPLVEMLEKAAQNGDYVMWDHGHR